MAEKNVTVVNATGLHARPAAALVQFVKNIPGDVEIIKDGKVANAKSIFNVMSLGISKGTEITVRVTGENAEEHVNQIVEFISGFTE
ncbi:MAG: HPr family phosphocarrier protein [Peptoniphilaceae bacterium]|nr:HPr family phosphocarrier protein [Peptoniphilaceae bacterium]MCI6659883.1 HPr family phosphocarrier protein [Peptoniphilaceae bacterium]MDD7434315.1 HPr family phosphocarrier protein [Peptoniphilaceae bacterium]MDY3075919.1 HPr family phosphocarrier protein [Peptoniphilaceae bacterium]MDY3987160.1 HPr family phosphocarrier protein [Peptoniphilaceae bacterium]